MNLDVNIKSNLNISSHLWCFDCVPLLGKKIVINQLIKNAFIANEFSFFLNLRLVSKQFKHLVDESDAFKIISRKLGFRKKTPEQLWEETALPAAFPTNGGLVDSIFYTVLKNQYPSEMFNTAGLPVSLYCQTPCEVVPVHQKVEMVVVPLLIQLCLYARSIAIKHREEFCRIINQNPYHYSEAPIHTLKSLLRLSMDLFKKNTPMNKRLKEILEIRKIKEEKWKKDVLACQTEFKDEDGVTYFSRDYDSKGSQAAHRFANVKIIEERLIHRGLEYYFVLKKFLVTGKLDQDPCEVQEKELISAIKFNMAAKYFDILRIIFTNHPHLLNSNKPFFQKTLDDRSLPKKELLTRIAIALRAGLDLNRFERYKDQGKVVERSLLLTASRYGNETLVKLLLHPRSSKKLDIKMRDKDGNNCLHLSLKSGNQKLFEFLCMEFLSAGGSYTEKNSAGENILHIACEMGFVKIIKDLAYQAQSMMYELDEKNETPLLKAINSPYLSKKPQLKLEILRILRAIDIEAKRNELFKPKLPHEKCIMHAISLQSGNICILKELSYRIINFNFQQKDDLGNTALHIAFAKKSPLDVIKYLVNELKFNLKAKNKTNQAMLHLACKDAGEPISLENILFLIENGADLNERDNYGMTPFHYLITSAKYARVSETLYIAIALLIEKEAKIEIQENMGRTPLHTACMDLVESDRTHRQYPAQAFSLIKLLIDQKLDPNQVDIGNLTPMHYLANRITILLKEFGNKIKGLNDLVKMELVELVSKGGNLKLANKKGTTPLSQLKEPFKTEFIDLLKAVVNERNRLKAEEEKKKAEEERKKENLENLGLIPMPIEKFQQIVEKRKAEMLKEAEEDRNKPKRPRIEFED